MTVQVAARNRRASFKYHILETFDAGISLTGPEVKSVRAGKVVLEDGFGRLDKDEIFLWNVHIAPYDQGAQHVKQEPTRSRKLLLHRTEIKRIQGKLTVKGYALVPLEMYFGKTGYAKVKIALAKGKTGADKRESIKKKDLNREMRKQFAGKFKA